MFKYTSFFRYCKYFVFITRYAYKAYNFVNFYVKYGEVIFLRELPRNKRGFAG